MELPPDQPRFDLAQREAEGILFREKIYEPPIPVDEVFSQFATIHHFMHPTASSFCCEHDLIWNVFINDNLPAQNNNHAKGHELGHMRMGHLRFDLSNLSKAQSSILKQEADCFSTNFIMPASLLYSACRHQTVNDSEACCLAKLYCVSSFSMRTRLHTLGLYSSHDFLTHCHRHPKKILSENWDDSITEMNRYLKNPEQYSLAH